MRNLSKVEILLKRFLKRKVAVTTSMVVAFMITGGVGYAEEIIEEHNNKYFKNERAFGYLSKANRIGAIIEKDYLGNDSIDNLKIIGSNINDESNSLKKVAGVYLNPGADLSALGKKINISAININNADDSYAAGIYRSDMSGYNNTTAKIGNNITELINIQVESTGEAFGILNGGEKINGYLTITSKVLNIDVKSSDINKGQVSGIHVGSYSTNSTSPKDASKIEVNAEKTIIKSDYAGLSAYSNGVLKINGDLEVEAEKVISTRGHSLIVVNEFKDKTIKLNGDIEFKYHTSSGTTVDSNVILNLSNKDSYFNGKISVTGNPPEGLDNVNGMKLGLSNGGTWNNNGDSFVNTLTFNNGVINNNGVNNNIQIDKLIGDGGAINMVAEIGADGVANSGSLTFDTIESTQGKAPRLAINYKGSGDAELTQEEAKKVFENLAEKIKVENGQLNASAKLEEGFVSSEYTAEYTTDSNGNGTVINNTVTQGNLNSMVEGMRDLATINLLTWRQEMNSLNKRMGELRDSTGEHGVWSRVYAGKIENGSRYDNNYQTYQVGYDKKYQIENGVLFVGGLVSYSDGKTDYALGDGENYSIGGGVYATWLNNSGHFADIILKQSRLHNKFDVTSKDLNKSQHGDYNNWGTSLSGQYGKRFDLDDRFFIEPSVELTFGRVTSEDYTTSAGVKVEQDTMYSLIGNLGTAVGYKFSKGNIYARASLVREFEGDIDTDYTHNGKTVSTSEALSDTWVEFGVGLNYRIAENINVYLDLERTGDATVDTEWQSNLGFRYEF